MFAREFGVSRERARRREVKILFDGQAQRAAGGGELGENDVAEFGRAEPEIAQAEGQIDFCVIDLGQEPGGIAVGRDSGFALARSAVLMLATRPRRGRVLQVISTRES
jgi:hypothetical protein